VLAGLVLFGLALGVRLYRLATQSLWLDEGGTWAEVTGRSGKGWLALVAELFSPDAGYPLYHLLLKAWVALAGDSEWALRFPSALAGALAVVALWLAATELQRSFGGTGGSHELHELARMPIGVVAIAVVSPFALWHAQDAKAYSLLLLVVALLLWTVLRALRIETRQAWLLVLGIAVAGVFVHRMGLLAASGALLTFALARAEGRGMRDEAASSIRALRALRGSTILLALALGALGVAGTIIAARTETAGAARVDAGPLAGLWLTFARFSLDRWPGDLDGYLGLPALVWLAPFGLLFGWGLVLLVRDMRDRHPAAIAVLCMLLVPLGLFALTLALAPVFQARYAMPAFPAWVLVVTYPLLRNGTDHEERSAKNTKSQIFSVLRTSFFVVILLASFATLLQPGKGLFSGDPVKEQWRDAVTLTAARAQPDDLILIQPYYVAPLWAYYAPRVTPDPLPQATTFPIFAEGDTCGVAAPTPDDVRECSRRRYEPFFQQAARGRKRALLLIAPDHAATVDPPVAPGDAYGWVGLRFQFEQRTWPCGGAEFVGVALMCQSFPEMFRVTGDPVVIPAPATEIAAVFGSELKLRGVTIAPHGGALRPGGTLPVTLFWQAEVPSTRRYRMFLHLCQECDRPPPANDDGPPLFGYAPAGDTTTWRVGDPVHDERALALPHDLPPGRYTLLLGVYPEGATTAEERLPITTAAPTLSADRLVVGEVVVGTQ
jgi:hypothetical protein